MDKKRLQARFEAIFDKADLTDDVIDQYGDWQHFWDQIFSRPNDNPHYIKLEVVRKAYGDSRDVEFHYLFDESDWKELQKICTQLQVELPSTYWMD